MTPEEKIAYIPESTNEGLSEAGKKQRLESLEKIAMQTSKHPAEESAQDAVEESYDAARKCVTEVIYDDHN